MALVFGMQEPIMARVSNKSPFGLFEVIVIVLAWGTILTISAIVVLSLLAIIGKVRNAAGVQSTA
jgi:hypothetical protein